MRIIDWSSGVCFSDLFRLSFAFIVAGARTGWIDIAEIILPLRMDLRTAINLAGGCEEEVRSTAFSQGQQVLHAEHARNQRMLWLGLVLRRGRPTGKVVTLNDVPETGQAGVRILDICFSNLEHKIKYNTI